MRFIQLLGTLLIFWTAAALPIAPASAQNGDAEQTDALGLPSSAEELFARATHALEQGTVSIRTLELLRSQLVSVRDRHAAIVNLGSVEADALQAQLDALGPVPPSGQKEADDIAARRAELIKCRRRRQRAGHSGKRDSIPRRCPDPRH
jgi:potassium efflux system protein